MHTHTQKTPLTKTYSLDLGECIGMESGIDLKSDMDNIIFDYHQKCENNKIRKIKKKEKKEKNYPPPLPKHPWVMKKHYSDDGDLIITQEKVDRHEYFESQRFDDRLVLRLVPLNDDVEEEEEDVEEAVEVEEEEENHRDGGGGEEDDDEAVVKKQEFGVGNKCYQYDTVSNSTMFSMGVQAIRPVHI